jgi:mono/diheme cytochrome c family protein
MKRSTSAACAALLLPVLALSCGSSAEVGGSPGAPPPAYVQAKCNACHGAEGGGGMLGPTLQGIAEHWTADELTEFIANPAPFVAERPRLREMLEIDYKMPMTANATLTEDERRALAEWVLAL